VQTVEPAPDKKPLPAGLRKRKRMQLWRIGHQNLLNFNSKWSLLGEYPEADEENKNQYIVCFFHSQHDFRNQF